MGRLSDPPPESCSALILLGVLYHLLSAVLVLPADPVRQLAGRSSHARKPWAKHRAQLGLDHPYCAIRPLSGGAVSWRHGPHYFVETDVATG